MDLVSSPGRIRNAVVVVVTFMTQGREYFASDLSTATVVFRPDLRCTPHNDARQPHVVVEDPISGTFYRLGKIEYAFAIRLTASRTIADAYRELCEQFPDHHLSEDEAADLCRWLISNELAHTESSKSSDRMLGSAKKASTQRVKERANPIAIRIPLLHCDRMVDRLTQYLGWLFGGYATAAGVILMLGAGCLAIANWEPLWRSSESLFSSSMLTLLVVVTVVLKLVHEFAHAIVCKRYGGNVGEMGVLLILLAPLAYVDVNSVWRFRSRWQRIHVAVAGIYVELMIASAAMLGWSVTSSPFVQHLCAGTILSAGIATLVFNANPLMKFDGYFILTDWAKTPNLYTDGQNHLLRLARRWFFGDSMKEPNWTPGYRIAVSTYAWLAIVWKCFVCAGLIVAAGKLFHGLGTLLSILACVAWIGGPLVRIVRQFQKAPFAKRMRFAGAMAVVMVSTVMLFAVIPWPGSAPVPAVVEYAPHEVIRAKVDGFVNQIHVDSGQHVRQGDHLLTLQNPDLVLKAEQLKSKMEQATIRQRQQTLSGRHAAAQAEETEFQSLAKQFAELMEQVDSLVIRAPRSGVVIRRQLDQIQGTYLAEGDEILVLGDESQKELRLLIPQSKYDQFRDQIGASVRYRVGGSPIETSSLAKIIPRAKTSVEYPALLACNGGPLAVRSVSADPSQPSPDVELLVPHFEAIVGMASSQSASFYSGQRASVSIGGFSETVGSHVWKSLLKWIE